MRTFLVVVTVLFVSGAAVACGPLRERLQQRRAALSERRGAQKAAACGAATGPQSYYDAAPKGVRYKQVCSGGKCYLVPDTN